MVLTTMHITRDDIHSGRYGGRSTVYDSYNNDRGRGDKNRTHDVSLKNCTIYPINCIDKTDTYEITELWQPLDVEKFENEVKETRYSKSISYSYKTKPSNKQAEIHTTFRHVKNDSYCDINIKGLNVDEAMRKLNTDYYHFSRYYNKEQISHSSNELSGYVPEYVSATLKETSYDYFISGEKTGIWYDESKKKARANMQIYENECLNLTFLNSVWVIYAIQNKKMGCWKIGNKTVDYATSVKYLNKALEYLKEREKKRQLLSLSTWNFRMSGRLHCLSGS